MEIVVNKLCSEERLMEYYMGELQEECDKLNMTIGPMRQTGSWMSMMRSRKR